MCTKIQEFDSLIEFMDFFNTEAKCIEYYTRIRWGDCINCPHCEHDKIYKFSDGKRYKCALCNKQFTVRTGTIYENSKVTLRKWFIATYLLASNKKGVSSYTLARLIKVTQKTGWFMLHRLRHKLSKEVEPKQLSGTIQLDETFVGGKNKNRHADKKVEQSQGRSFKDKTPVMGMLQQQIAHVVYRPHKLISTKIVQEKVIEQQSKVIGIVVKDTSVNSLQPNIHKYVSLGSIIISDEWCGYEGLCKYFDHRVIDHRAKQYVDDAGNTTNALEGFWTLFKRAYIGIYHFMSRKHLQYYVNEVIYRYNTRSETDSIRWINSLGTAHTPLTYKQLTQKV